MPVKAKRVGFGAEADGVNSPRAVSRPEVPPENAARLPAAEDDALHKAFLLAHFINGDREDAMRIVAGAAAKLRVAASAQVKRLYYHPSGRTLPGRARSGGFRNKVSLNDLHLLQRLVYIESEFYERRREQSDNSSPIRREDLLVHFIKHLVRITVKRNSFYVTLGLSRLLFNYNTAETMEIYNVVVQDPERVKDDYYYRSRKGVLMNELKERFGNLVKTRRGARGEERFEAEDGPEHYARLVGRCLSLFTPWDTACLVPAGFDPVTDSIPDLAYRSQSEEDETEVGRMHAILHPDCYQRLMEALGFQTPDERLTVPRFFVSHEGGGENNSRDPDRYSPPELSEQDLLTIKRSLGEQSARRRANSARSLRILVDGIERARLDLDRERRTSFAVGDDAELIEVLGDKADGVILFASHLLTRNAAGDALEPFAASITLEGRQKLSIVVSPSQEVGAQRDATPANVTVSYRETNPLRAAALSLRQTEFRLRALLARDPQPLAAGQSSFRQRAGSKRLAIAATFAFLILCAAATALYLLRRGGPVEQAGVTGNESPPVMKETPVSPINPTDKGEAVSDTPPRDRDAEQKTPGGGAQRATPPPPRNARPHAPAPGRPSPQPNEEAARVDPSARENDAPPRGSTPAERESTRSLSGAQKAVSLAGVKKIHVEVGGDAALAGSLRAELTSALRATGRFVLPGNRDEADALFKISLNESRPTPRRRDAGGAAPQSVSVVARLVNARGDVIWPARLGNSGGRYEGMVRDVVSAITRDLLDDIRKLER